tara:strand:- start:6042 stop:6941 length:900 start_codon:yes stop_codon:yes gene_type:complete
MLDKILGIGGAIGGGLLTKEAYDRLSDIGEQAVLGTTVGEGADAQRIPGTLEMAQQALELSKFKPFTVTSATGGRFGVTPEVDPTTGAITGVGADLAVSPEEQALQAGLMGGAEQFFGQAMTPTAQREQEVFDRIRATQVAEEERQRLALEERLFNQGRLGVRTSMFGGSPEQFALAQAQEEARNRASLLAIQQAQAEQAQQSTLGTQMLGASYVPQAQLLNVQQASQLFPQLQQQAQLFGAGEFGETQISGLQARLIAEQARANLLGNLGSGILGGLFSPVATQDGGVGSLVSSLFTT